MLNKEYKKIADQLDIDEEVVKAAYLSFWEFVRSSVVQLSLKEELTEEEYKKLRTNFNVPSLGKLTCSYQRYKNVKLKYKHLKSLNNDSKEN